MINLYMPKYNQYIVNEEWGMRNDKTYCIITFKNCFKINKSIAIYDYEMQAFIIDKREETTFYAKIEK